MSQTDAAKVHRLFQFVCTRVFSARLGDNVFTVALIIRRRRMHKAAFGG